MKKNMISALKMLFGQKTSFEISEKYTIVFSREIFELNQMLIWVDESISYISGERDKNLIGKSNTVSTEPNHPDAHVYGARIREVLKHLMMLKNDILMRIEVAEGNLKDCQTLVGPV